MTAHHCCLMESVHGWVEDDEEVGGRCKSTADSKMHGLFQSMSCYWRHSFKESICPHLNILNLFLLLQRYALQVFGLVLSFKHHLCCSSWKYNAHVRWDHHMIIFTLRHIQRNCSYLFKVSGWWRRSSLQKGCAMWQRPFQSTHKKINNQVVTPKNFHLDSTKTENEWILLYLILYLRPASHQVYYLFAGQESGQVLC